MVSDSVAPLVKMAASRLAPMALAIGVRANDLFPDSRWDYDPVGLRYRLRRPEADSSLQSAPAQSAVPNH
jgi:hypothetical protein